MTNQGHLFHDFPDYVGFLERHPLYKTWAKMCERCDNINAINYVYYGLRGITVSDEFRSSASFIGWALVNGWEPGLQLDRKDNDGPYSSANCRFVTRSENMRNRRDTILIMGAVPAIELAEYRGIKAATFHSRIKRGWLPHDAASCPVGEKPSTA